MKLDKRVLIYSFLGDARVHVTKSDQGVGVVTIHVADGARSVPAQVTKYTMQINRRKFLYTFYQILPKYVLPGITSEVHEITYINSRGCIAGHEIQECENYINIGERRLMDSAIDYQETHANITQAPGMKQKTK